jgi:hypothetical protein
MAFPFVPCGAMLAVAVLAGAMTVFGVALRLMDRAFAGGRRTMLPGVVAGFRNWSDEHPAKLASPAPAGPEVAAPAIEIELVELFDRRIDDSN